MTASGARIAAPAIVAFIKDAMLAVGLPGGDAARIAELMTEADLTGADMTGADLFKANFSETKLDEADFRGARLEALQRESLAPPAVCVTAPLLGEAPRKIPRRVFGYAHTHAPSDQFSASEAGRGVADH